MSAKNANMRRIFNKKLNDETEKSIEDDAKEGCENRKEIETNKFSFKNESLSSDARILQGSAAEKSNAEKLCDRNGPENNDFSSCSEKCLPKNKTSSNSESNEVFDYKDMASPSRLEQQNLYGRPENLQIHSANTKDCYSDNETYQTVDLGKTNEQNKRQKCELDGENVQFLTKNSFEEELANSYSTYPTESYHSIENYPSANQTSKKGSRRNQKSSEESFEQNIAQNSNNQHPFDARNDYRNNPNAHWQNFQFIEEQISTSNSSNNLFYTQLSQQSENLRYNTGQHYDSVPNTHEYGSSRYLYAPAEYKSNSSSYKSTESYEFATNDSINEHLPIQSDYFYPTEQQYYHQMGETPSFYSSELPTNRELSQDLAAIYQNERQTNHFEQNNDFSGKNTANTQNLQKYHFESALFCVHDSYEVLLLAKDGILAQSESFLLSMFSKNVQQPKNQYEKQTFLENSFYARHTKELNPYDQALPESKLKLVEIIKNRPSESQKSKIRPGSTFIYSLGLYLKNSSKNSKQEKTTDEGNNFTENTFFDDSNPMNTSNNSSNLQNVRSTPIFSTQSKKKIIHRWTDPYTWSPVRQCGIFTVFIRSDHSAFHDNDSDLCLVKKTVCVDILGHPILKELICDENLTVSIENFTQVTQAFGPNFEIEETERNRSEDVDTNILTANVEMDRFSEHKMSGLSPNETKFCNYGVSERNSNNLPQNERLTENLHSETEKLKDLKTKQKMKHSSSRKSETRPILIDRLHLVNYTAAHEEIEGICCQKYLKRSHPESDIFEISFKTEMKKFLELYDIDTSFSTDLSNLEKSQFFELFIPITLKIKPRKPTNTKTIDLLRKHAQPRKYEFKYDFVDENAEKYR